MIGLFLFGENLPFPIGPPAVSIIAASLALLLIYGVRIEPVENVLRDIDWKTLVFLGCIFLLVQSITKTGLVQGFSLKLYEWFGTEHHPRGVVADRGDRTAVKPAGEYPGSGRLDLDGQRLPRRG